MVRESSAELTKEGQLRRAYTEFFQSRDGRQFTKEWGKSIPLGRDWSRPPGNGEADVQFCDPCDLPRSSVFDHPIDHIEPAEDFRAIDGVSHEDTKQATAIFESAMRWCIEAPNLVAKGQRSAVVISTMRGDLRGGLRIDKKAERTFKEANAHLNGAMELTGRLFGPALEWLRRGDRVSELGERIMILFYVLRPSELSPGTLRELGLISNKTRQAKDKLANCLRDSFSGINARAMRGDRTRIKCRSAQLAR